MKQTITISEEKLVEFSQALARANQLARELGLQLPDKQTVYKKKIKKSKKDDLFTMVKQMQKRTAHLDPIETERVIDEAVEAVRHGNRT